MTAASPRHRHGALTHRKERPPIFLPYDHLAFTDVELRANQFANHIESYREELTETLLTYESFEVVQDETARTLDLLRNLHENKNYFQLRIGSVAAFLPRNQPLYALTCFVLVPSLMSSDVHFRVPYSLRNLFPQLLDLLEIHKFFPNVIVSPLERLPFLIERSALRIDPSTQETWPVTDAVIFTGTPNHAERLRKIFDRRTLFIANGAGHNPVVVSQDADIPAAVEAVLTLQLYNQGQDCAAPNAILVHHRAYHQFLRLLRDGLSNVRVGQYRDRTCRVGPISDPRDLIRIQQVLVDNRAWLDPSTRGIIRTADAIVEPTLVCKPLSAGGNFTELFAPILFVQRYESDADLSQYFENSHYARNAMYISIYGTSQYVENLIERSIGGAVLHRRESILRNTHLHVPGIERGTLPYGGSGVGASSFSIDGVIRCQPTLPQRDMRHWLIRTSLRGQTHRTFRLDPPRGIKIVRKDVPKLLGLKSNSSDERKVPATTGESYIDSHALQVDGRRYLCVNTAYTFQLLDKPNLDYAATLEPEDLRLIRALKRFLGHRPVISVDQFSTWLYSLPKKTDASDRENRSRQLRFFTHLYQLLFGRDSGPRLAHFLLDTNRRKVAELLDV